MADDLREYIVTLKDYKDLDDFYNDMESPGGNLYIPHRAVDVYNRRPISRNTHYLLTDQEADQIRNDPRVEAVTLNPIDAGVVISPSWTQTGLFSKKTSSFTSNDKNWGLLRGTLGSQISGWGNGGGGTSTTQNATITRKLSGSNVDVVIVDGILKYNHAEFKTNVNGTGASRINQFNWYSLNPIVSGTSAGTYVYTDTTFNTNHGTHVAGIAVGNTQGWAKNANIYNISPYGENSIGLAWFDYIRAWHNQKSINPNTGFKNPTICNNSYAFVNYVNVNNISSIIHRGTTYTGTWNSTGNGTVNYTDLGFPYNALEWNYTGVYELKFYTYLPYFIADVQDAINDGIHVVWAAGNDNYRLDVPGGPDYDNRVMVVNNPNYINRHNVSSIDEVIVVGAVSANADEKIIYNKGPDVDLFAPGTWIMSSIGQTSPSGDVDDPRGLNGDRLASYGGTSMAAPQVTGVMACILESSISLSTTSFKSSVLSIAKNDQLPSPGTGVYSDLYHLQGANNKIIYIPEFDIQISLSTTLLSNNQTLVYSIIPVNNVAPSQLFVTFTGAATQAVFASSYNSFSFTAIGSTPNYFNLTTIDNLQESTSFQIEVRVGGYAGTVITTSTIISISQQPSPPGSFQWNETEFLGTLTMYSASELSVNVAQTENLNLKYSLDFGLLPSGLTLSEEGLITGVVSTSTTTLSSKYITATSILNTVSSGTSVFYLNSALNSVFNLTLIDVNDTLTSSNPGLTANTKVSNISTNSFSILPASTGTLASGSIFSFYRTTESINTYTFAISVHKLAGEPITTASFSINVVNKKTKSFCEIYFKPNFPLDQRKIWDGLVNNTKIFNSNFIYRPSDSNFGIQKETKCIIHYDFELLPISTFSTIFNQNFYRRRFILSNPKIRYAKVNGDIVYEVVYLDIIDYNVLNDISVPKTIFLDGVNYYPATFENMRKQLEENGETNPDIIPRHFQTLQANEIRPDTYSPIVILCYALPGKGKSIVDRINNENIKFNQLDFTVNKVLIKNHYTGKIDSIRIDQNPRIS